MRLARLPGVTYSLGVCFIIYRWCQRLYGHRAACLGVTLWCIDPTVLAFTQLVTPDVLSAFCAVASTYIYWRFLRTPSTTRAASSGLVLGLALLSKFTLLVLVPAWILLALLVRPDAEENANSLRQRQSTTRDFLLIGLLCLVVVNAGYGFKESFLSLKEYHFVSRTLAGPPADGRSAHEHGSWGNRFGDRVLGYLPVPVPADYAYGIDLQKREFENRHFSYLRGVWRHRGWWYYYLYGLAVKTPIGSSALILWGLVVTLRGRPGCCPRRVEAAVLLTPAILLLAISSQTGMNHHLRYALPVYPFLMITTGKLVYFLGPGKRLSSFVLIGLLGWSTLSGLSVYPHSMSYFNELVGGPRNGHAHLIDSNIDWGQDLLFGGNTRRQCSSPAARGCSTSCAWVTGAPHALLTSRV